MNSLVIMFVKVIVAVLQFSISRLSRKELALSHFTNLLDVLECLLFVPIASFCVVQHANINFLPSRLLLHAGDTEALASLLRIRSGHRFLLVLVIELGTNSLQ